MAHTHNPVLFNPSAICDSTCFSEAFISEDYAGSQDYSILPNADSSSYTMSATGTTGTGNETRSRTRTSKNRPKTLNALPCLPKGVNFSALTQPTRFKPYVAAEFPAAVPSLPLVSLSPSANKYTEALRQPINTQGINSLLGLHRTSITSADRSWVTSHLFSDSRLCTAFKPDLITGSKLWVSGEDQTFASFPSEMNEASFATWLNQMSNSIGVLHGAVPQPQPQGTDSTRSSVALGCADRVFDSSTHNKGPSGGYIYRKPDVAVIDRTLKLNMDAQSRYRWPFIEAFIELNSSESKSDLLRQINQKAAVMFESQPQRRFVCSIGFFGSKPKDMRYLFVLVDRAGLTHTEPARISSFAALDLCRILFALAFASAEALGCDPTMEADPISGEILSINVVDTHRNTAVGIDPNPTSKPSTARMDFTFQPSEIVKFKVIRMIFVSKILYGRGTRVWIVQRLSDGAFFVLKDYWPLATHVFTEIDYLRRIKDQLAADPEGKRKFGQTYPKIEMGQDLQHSTHDHRGALINKPVARTHRRIVSGPIGDPLTTFRSRKEFTKAILDAVNWLEYLWQNCGIIHGDISVNNIIIIRNLLAPSQISIIQNPATTSAPNALSSSSAVVAPSINTFEKVSADGTSEEIEVGGGVIDHDYSGIQGQYMHHTSGTLPYMSIEALKGQSDFKHSPGHDLESVLHSMIGVCNYTQGPGGQFRVPLPEDVSLPVDGWYTEINRHRLARDKAIHLMAFDFCIRARLPAYWKPFADVLQGLIKATWSGVAYLEAPNVATHAKYQSILEVALKEFSNEQPCPYAYIPPNKRVLEGTSEEERPEKKRRQERGLKSLLTYHPRPDVVHNLHSWQDVDG